MPVSSRFADCSEEAIEATAHSAMVSASWECGGFSAEEASAISAFIAYCLWRRDAASVPPCPSEDLVQEA